MYPKLIRIAIGSSVVVALFPSISRGAGPVATDTPCSQGQTKRLVTAFVRAYNRANVDGMDRLWAHEPDFEWYFVDEERGPDEAEDRLTLRSYFEERVSLNDHLRLRRLRVNKNGTDFAFKLRRTTDDDRVDAAGLFHGKGATRETVLLPILGEPLPSRTCLLIVWTMDNHKN